MGANAELLRLMKPELELLLPVLDEKARRQMTCEIEQIDYADYALVTCRALGLSVALGYTNIRGHDRRELSAPSRQR
jgi:hypothetical protein